MSRGSIVGVYMTRVLVYVVYDMWRVYVGLYDIEMQMQSPRFHYYVRTVLSYTILYYTIQYAQYAQYIPIKIPLAIYV